jgi:hypothetical protein
MPLQRHQQGPWSPTPPRGALRSMRTNISPRRVCLLRVWSRWPSIRLWILAGSLHATPPPVALTEPSDRPTQPQSPIATSPRQPRKRFAMSFGVGFGDIIKAIEICRWIWTNVFQGHLAAGEWRDTLTRHGQGTYLPYLDSQLTMESRSRPTIPAARSRGRAAPTGPRPPPYSPPGGPRRT